jgi:hypothetical protein
LWALQLLQAAHSAALGAAHQQLGTQLLRRLALKTLSPPVDFDRLNSGAMRSGRRDPGRTATSSSSTRFDCKIAPEHVMRERLRCRRLPGHRIEASTTGTAASSPTRPAMGVDCAPRQDTLAFQVDCGARAASCRATMVPRVDTRAEGTSRVLRAGPAPGHRYRSAARRRCAASGRQAAGADCRPKALRQYAQRTSLAGQARRRTDKVLLTSYHTIYRAPSVY